MFLNYLLFLFITWLEVCRSVLTGQLEVAVHLSRLKCVECKHPIKYQVAVTVSTRCKDKLVPAKAYHYNGGEETKNLNYFACDFEYEHIWESHNLYITKVFRLDLDGKSADIDRIAHFRIDLPALPSYMRDIALYVEFKLMPLSDFFGSIPLTKQVVHNKKYINSVVIRVTNIAKGISEYTQVIFDKWKMQLQLDAVIHAYFVGFDSKELEYGTVEERENYDYWDNILGRWRHKEVKNWFRGYPFGDSNGTNGLPKLFSESTPDFVDHLLKDVLDKQDKNTSFSKSTVETLAGLRLAYFIYAKMLAEHCHKISNMIAGKTIYVGTNVPARQPQDKDQESNSGSKEVKLDVAGIDSTFFIAESSKEDDVLLKTITLKDGYRLTEVLNGQETLWKGGDQDLCLGAWIYYDENNSPVSLILNHVGVHRETYWTYYTKQNIERWKPVNMEEHRGFLKEIKEKVTPTTPVTLNLSKPNPSKINVTSGGGSGLIYSTYSPKDGHHIEKLVDGQTTVWTSFGDGYKCTSAEYFSKDDIAILGLDINHGDPLKRKCFEKNGNHGWSTIADEEFVDRHESIAESSLTDLTSKADGTLFAVEDVEEDNVPVLKLTAKPNVQATRLTYDGKVLWIGQAGDFCLSATLYFWPYGNPICAIFRFKRNNQTIEGYRKFDGKWNPVNKKGLEELLEELKNDSQESIFAPQDVTLDLSSVDRGLFDTGESTVDNVPFKAFTPKDGNRITEIKDGQGQVWKGENDREYGKSVVVYYDTGASPALVTVTFVKSDNQATLRCYKKDSGQWKWVDKKAFDTLLKEMKRIVALLKLNVVKLDLNNVDNNTFNVKDGNDEGAPIKTFTPKEGNRLTEVTSGQKSLWNAGDKEHGKTVLVYFEGNKPLLTVINYVKEDGKAPWIYYNKKDDKWTQINKKDFEEQLRKLKDAKSVENVEAGPSTSSATRPSGNATLSSRSYKEVLSVFNQSSIIEITASASLVSSEKGGKVEFAMNGLNDELRKLLEDVAEKLGIESASDNHIHVPLGDSLKLKMKDVLIDYSLGNNAVESAVKTLKSNLENLQTFLESLFKEFLEVQRTVNAFDLYGKDYWYNKSLFFKQLVSQTNSDQVLSLIKPLNITDEHHFFIVDTFPYIKKSPELIKIDPSSKYVEKDYTDHLVILVHGYGPNSITVRGFRNNIMTIFRGTKCEVCISTARDFNQPIKVLAKRLAKEIEDYLRSPEYRGIRRISFVTISLGGILVRTVIRYLDDEYVKKLHAFITAATPHIGYPSDPTREIAPCIMSCFACCQGATCLQELLLKDIKCCSSGRNSFLYKLSNDPGISKFKKIVLIGIKKDKKVYAYSALINASKMRTCATLGKEMEANIMKHIKGIELTRVLVTYGRAKKYLDETGRFNRFFFGRNNYAHSNVFDERIVNRILLSMLYDTF